MPLCAGEGRVHQCLRDNFQKLADTCRKEELKLNIIQSRDVRLRPKLQKACSEEIAVYCKDTQPGARSPKLASRMHVFVAECSHSCLMHSPGSIYDVF